MIAVRLSNPLEQRLAYLSEVTKRSKSYYVKEAIGEYLDEHEEILLAISRIEKKNPKIPLEELEKRLGLES